MSKYVTVFTEIERSGSIQFARNHKEIAKFKEKIEFLKFIGMFEKSQKVYLVNFGMQEFLQFTTFQTQKIIHTDSIFKK